MNYGSICSGVEAATLAWAPLGWKAVSMCVNVMAWLGHRIDAVEKEIAGRGPYPPTTAEIPSAEGIISKCKKQESITCPNTKN